MLAIVACSHAWTWPPTDKTHPQLNWRLPVPVTPEQEGFVHPVLPPEPPADDPPIDCRVPTDRARDFNEWATVQQLVGIDRVYVADQLRYRHQVLDQVHRGFAVLTHDYPHRYVHPGQRDAPQPPTSYEPMFYSTTSAYNMLCLHEHWYDDWVFVSYSTDEFFIFFGDIIETGREVSNKQDQQKKRESSWRTTLDTACCTDFFSGVDLLTKK